MNGLTTLHWTHLTRALQRYQKLGYLDIACPWNASAEATRITLPWGREPTKASTPNQEMLLVGSAEQALLDLALRGQLPDGKPVCCLTPCFRLDEEGPYHHPYFMKIELGCFWRSSTPFKQIVARAELFQDHARILHLMEFGQEPLLGPDQPKVVHTHHGWLRDVPLPDLQINGIEVGSYGARSWKSTDGNQFLAWAYGTGLAMPRALEALTAKGAMSEAPVS